MYTCIPVLFMKSLLLLRIKCVLLLSSQLVQPPPQKKAKLEDNKALSVHKERGMANTTEDDDVIPKIKSSHLDLDDVPVELLPTHQEKIMKQVCVRIELFLVALLLWI